LDGWRSIDVCDDDIADDPLQSPEAAEANDEPWDMFLTRQITRLYENPDSADYSPTVDTRQCFYCECFETETVKLKLCKRCDIAVYCSKECQTKHWKGLGKSKWLHKIVCLADLRDIPHCIYPLDQDLH
jgi:hypothetical protein